VTKNAMIERDLDILVPMAERNLVHVFISINSLDNKLASKLEPRASAPHRRMKAVETLSKAGVPVGVLVAPIIPALNEKDVEAIIEQAGVAGARSSGYTCVRLPHELKQLFRKWLELHYQPDSADEWREGLRPELRDAHGRAGVFADLIRKRVQIATRKAGLDWAWDTVLDTSRFVPPRVHSPQGELF
jgi:DNA repair photolyase